jgi:hypothetical protein
MRYRNHLPQHRLFLDALIAAVPAILGLTLSSFIQVLVDSLFVLGHKPALNRLGLGMPPAMPARAGFFASRSCLMPHLSRRIGAEAVACCCGRPRGLPLILFSLLVITSVYFSTIDDRPPTIAVPKFPILIVTEVGGRIQQIYVKEGSFVHEGDLVIQLDADKLLVKKLILESRIHDEESIRFDPAYALPGLYRQLHEIQVDLGRLTITSPADGRIMSVAPLYPGEIITSGAAIAVMVP